MYYYCLSTSLCFLFLYKLYVSSVSYTKLTQNIISRLQHITARRHSYLASFITGLGERYPLWQFPIIDTFLFCHCSILQKCAFGPFPVSQASWPVSIFVLDCLINWMTYLKCMWKNVNIKIKYKSKNKMYVCLPKWGKLQVSEKKWKL